MEDLQTAQTKSGRSRKKLVMAIFISGAIIIVLAAFWLWTSGQREVLSPASSTGQMPPANLISAIGRIINIIEIEDAVIMEVQAVGQQGWEAGVLWRLAPGADTVLATMDEWRRTHQTTPQGEPIPFDAPMYRLDPKDYQVGDLVYILANTEQDLGISGEVINPKAILILHD